MSKYNVPSDHWEDSEEESPQAWQEDTYAQIEIEVTLKNEGYQTNKKWTVHCWDKTDDGEGVTAGWAIKHTNKGNYWRNGDRHEDAVDFVELPLRVRQRVAAILCRPLEAITPEHKLVNNE